jgi:hypothetical protein
MVMRDKTKYFFKNTSQNKTKNTLKTKKTGYKRPAKATGQNFSGDRYNDEYDNSSRTIKKIFIAINNLVANDAFLFDPAAFFFAFATFS